MKLEDVVAVSGLAGLHKMVANRNNGLIVEDLDSGKRRFASSRKHQFTPLASIGIYTDDDTTELRIVFKAMQDQLESNPPIAPNSSASDLATYFEKILPEYDRDRVYPGDIKKVIKWFNFLHKHNLLEEALKEEEPAEATDASEDEATADNPPAETDDNPKAESEEEE